MNKQTFLMLVSLFLLSSCATQPQEKELFVLLAHPEDGSVGEILVTNSLSSTPLNTAGASVQVSPDSPPVPVELGEAAIQDLFGAALSALPQAAESFMLFFLPDKAVLNQESWDFLPELLEKIQTRNACEVTVIGHTDTMGTADYNLQISLQRAEWMRDELVALGIPSERIHVEARGDTDLLISTADNVPELKNRRVEIILR
jgi:outer membrane protein OmpA-like peptidoglycan-associated protein